MLSKVFCLELGNGKRDRNPPCEVEEADPSVKKADAAARQRSRFLNIRAGLSGFIPFTTLTFPRNLQIMTMSGCKKTVPELPDMVFLMFL